MTEPPASYLIEAAPVRLGANRAILPLLRLRSSGEAWRIEVVGLTLADTGGTRSRCLEAPRASEPCIDERREPERLPRSLLRISEADRLALSQAAIEPLPSAGSDAPRIRHHRLRWSPGSAPERLDEPSDSAPGERTIAVL